MRGNTEVLGTPGRHAAGLAHKAGAQAAGFGALAAGAALGAVAALFGGWHVGFVIVGAICAAGAFAAAQKPSTAAAKANVGASAERKVGRIIERWAAANHAARVVHGAELGYGGDADHVIIAAPCVVVETKYGRGKVRVAADGRVQVGNKTLRGNPVAQCERQRKQLAGITSSPVVGIVCISDGTGAWSQHGNIIICGARSLPKALAASTGSPPNGERWKAIIPKT